MPAVVPSQIVQYIEKTFKADERIEGQPITIHTGPSGALNGLIHLVDQVPSVLLPSDPEMYAAMIRSIEEIRFAVKRAESQDYRAAALTGPPDLRPFAPGQPSPVEIIRRAFAKCPDEVATGESQELLFIKDSEIRSALLRDLATTRSALSMRNGRRLL